jgi:hypothetical protein
MRVPALGFVLGIAFLASCSYDQKSQEYSATVQVTPHFSSINALIIQPKCMPCHAGRRGSDFTTYEGVLNRVVAGDPAASRFYTDVRDGKMPIYQPMLSDDELLAIYQWIQNGAKND